jgi:hypothetical protein
MVTVVGEEVVGTQELPAQDQLSKEYPSLGAAVMVIEVPGT